MLEHDEVADLEGALDVDGEADEVSGHFVDRSRAVGVDVARAAFEHRRVLRDFRPLHPGKLALQSSGVEQRGLGEDVDAVDQPVVGVAQRSRRAAARHRSGGDGASVRG